MYHVQFAFLYFGVRAFAVKKLRQQGALRFKCFWIAEDVANVCIHFIQRHIADMREMILVFCIKRSQEIMRQ